MLTVVLVVAAAAIVFVIAAIAVGRVTAGLVGSPERAVYDPDQSLSFVAEALPAEVTAELSYDDVGRMLRLFHDFLHANGVATTAGGDEARREPAVVDIDAAASYVIERGRLVDVDISADHAAAVIDAQMAYFEAIGVLGDPVEGTDEPT